MSDIVTPEALFECQQCGDCCKGFGGTYVAEKDIQAIAGYIHASPRRFRERFCQPSGSRWVLRQGENGYCVFWRDGLCGIHPVKPRMCRQWPFIRSILVDVRNWRAMAASCPGMNADGVERQILACVKRKLAGETPTR